jgi:PTS system fructose-specific IIA component/PTS system nitrogen regulatory IIA component
MGMTAYIVRQAVIAELRAVTKEDVIREMVEALYGAGVFKDTPLEDLVQAVLRRERAASTGIGRGVAIPHAKHPSVSKVVGTLAVSRRGVDFDSIDGKPVHIFVLLISPPDQASAHLRALETVSRTLRDEQLVRALLGASTAEAIWRLLEEADRRSPGVA